MRVSQHFMVIAEKKAAMDAAKETASASATPSAKRRRPAGGSGARGGSSTKSRKSSGGASVSGGGGGGGRSSSSSDDDDDDKENDEDDDDGGEWTTQRLVALGSEIKIWDKLMDIYDGDAAVATADPALKKRGSSDDVPTKLRKSRQILARLGSASEFEIARNAMPNPRYFW